ncbi:MAG: class I SAM-dependent methyltransferase [Pseudomonadota bacterium]
MGIGPVAFEYLAEMSTRFRPAGPSVMLGRQKIRLKKTRGKTFNRFAKALKRSGAQVDLAGVLQPDGYAEAMFRTLGFGDVDALDMADHEGAQVIWDLNKPVPEDWHGRFSFIFDGGTLEHVFDVAQSFANIHALLAPGGRFAAMTPLNGFAGHGFYQFSPELIWTYWKEMAGCDVHACRAVHLDGTYDEEMPDPRLVGRRVQPKSGPAWLGGMPNGRIALWYEVEKTGKGGIVGDVQQSDYQTRWAAEQTETRAMEMTT